MSQNKKPSENLVSKVTVSTVYGKIKTTIKKTEEGDIRILEKDTMLMRLFGQATGYQVKTSQYGDSLQFEGIFKAINAETGEIFRSGKCFLPKVFESHLGGLLDQIETGAEFALDIYAIPANNAFGYEYRVRPLLEVQESPVLARLESLVYGTPQLAAPAPTAPAEGTTEAPKDSGKSGKKGGGK